MLVLVHPCRKCTISVSNGDHGQGMQVWGQGTYGASVSPPYLCCKPNTALKNKVLKIKWAILFLSDL